MPDIVWSGSRDVCLLVKTQVIKLSFPQALCATRRDTITLFFLFFFGIGNGSGGSGSGRARS